MLGNLSRFGNAHEIKKKRQTSILKEILQQYVKKLIYFSIVQSAKFIQIGKDRAQTCSF